ncbi:MAG: hypothetical protein ACOY0T_08610 [Myxococcota bacterium]
MTALRGGALFSLCALVAAACGGSAFTGPQAGGAGGSAGQSSQGGSSAGRGGTSDAGTGPGGSVSGFGGTSGAQGGRSAGLGGRGGAPGAGGNVAAGSPGAGGRGSGGSGGTVVGSGGKGGAAGAAGKSGSGGTATGGAAGKGGTLGSGGVASGGAPASGGAVGQGGNVSGGGVCKSASDCRLQNDCCACLSVGTGELTATCNLACIQSACAAIGITADDVACIAGRCVFSRSCNTNRAMCEAEPPTCAAGKVPSIDNGCWGPCIPVGECSQVTSCKDCEAAGLVCVTDQLQAGPVYHCVSVPPACNGKPNCQCMSACLSPLQCGSATETNLSCVCPTC